MEKKKDIIKIILCVILGLLLIVIGVCGFMIYSKLNETEEPVEEITTDIYEIPNNPTEYQSQIYQELAILLQNFDLNNSDQNPLLELVAKSFVADYFTWSNKRGSYDIGGLDYFFGPRHANFDLYSRNELYNDLDILLTTYGQENMPSVNNIEISEISKMEEDWTYDVDMFDYETQTYNLVTTSYPVYSMKADWTYVVSETSTFDINKMPNSCYLYLVLRDNRYEVVHIAKTW